jgi:hypothetical protein
MPKETSLKSLSGETLEAIELIGKDLFESLPPFKQQNVIDEIEEILEKDGLEWIKQHKRILRDSMEQLESM